MTRIQFTMDTIYVIYTRIWSEQCVNLPICDKIWYQKLRRVNKFERRIKEKQRRGKYRKAWSPNYNAPTAKRIQRKQKSRVQVYRLAFYLVELHGEVYMASYFSTLHFDIFPTTSQLVVPTLICKPKTRCTVTTVPKLICIPERTKRDDRYGDCVSKLELYIHTSTNIDKAAITQINKRNRHNSFCIARANIDTIR